ncbi:SMI1/KNR4 family protein [Bacillus sp. CGMCC 1.60114]|uniref:SMI1/KNR4 family protein n=1 Tax=unclassified Bacillus (in: firmicutes) TaxID=185979 RepID=UPI0036332CBE
MSWNNYKKAITLMEQYEDECDFVGERSEDLIKKAEQALELRLSNMYREFVKRYGAGSFGINTVTFQDRYRCTIQFVNICNRK